jgi:MFS family permease
LIADATAEEHRGAAFGFHRTMDTCGAILGPLIALAVLYFRPQTPLHWLFFMALVPGLASSLLVALFLKDAPHEPDPQAARTKARFWQKYPAAFWHLIAANAIFSFGNSSDSFLILRATELHFGTGTAAATSAVADFSRQAVFATTLFAAFNIVYALLATPAGILSDRLSRKSVISIGWLIYAAVYAGFAFAGNSAPAAAWVPWALFAVYGIYQAFTEGVTKAYVSDLVPASQRAGAIGFYYTVSGFCQLGASLLAGFLWSHWGAAPAFLAGTVASLLAIPVLLTIPGKRTGQGF